jgi:glycosyltransferase involved in cell wall biosynthesis
MYFSKKKAFLSLSIICSSWILLHSHDALYDINIVGYLRPSSSVSRHTESFVRCLDKYDNVKIIPTQRFNLGGFDKQFESRNKKRIFRNKMPLTGISIFCDLLIDFDWKFYADITNEATIKFVYAVTERTVLLPEWVKKLNKNFDAVLVPDEWLVEVYKSSGVNVPVFVLPLSLALDSLLDKPLKRNTNKPFLFGFSGGNWPRKNQKLLIKAFNAVFKDSNDVSLVIHSRLGCRFDTIKKMKEDCKGNNILLNQKRLSRREYEDFLYSLDCYVSLSKGEGFSIIPREMLALGIPCIISNNTSQKTICNSGLVYSVRSDVLEPSDTIYSKIPVGYDFNCTLSDAKAAFQEVYSNYEYYVNKAHQGKEWVKQYLPENLEKKYASLVMPKKIVLGDRNVICENELITNSEILFKKYQSLR